MIVHMQDDRKIYGDLHTIVLILFSEMWLLFFRICRFQNKEFRKILRFCECRFSGERATAAATTAPVKSSTGRTTVAENSSSEKLQTPQSSRKNGTWQHGAWVVWKLLLKARCAGYPCLILILKDFTTSAVEIKACDSFWTCSYKTAGVPHTRLLFVLSQTACNYHIISYTSRFSISPSFFSRDTFRAACVCNSTSMQTGLRN